MTAKALLRIDPSPQLVAWIKQLSKAGNQGPFGQAHFVEPYFRQNRELHANLRRMRPT